MQKFAPHQVLGMLDRHAKDGFTGIVQIDVKLHAPQQSRSRLIVFENGEITYAGLNLPQAQQLVEQMGQYLHRKHIAPAINLANKKAEGHTSIGEYLKLFLQLGLFNQQEFEQFMQNAILWTIEQILPYAGTATIASEDLNILHYMRDLPSFRWHQLSVMLELRQQDWHDLAPHITSPEAIPDQLVDTKKRVKNGLILEHLRHYVDGHRTLTQIAYKLKQDPLNLAKTYHQWIERGWIRCKNPHQQLGLAPVQDALPKILSVDDSPVAQMMIKRSISDRYQVLLANNAVDALNLLNQDRIALILLDVTMPEIDGLELCRTVRSIAKFKDLPVIMLTAKDGVIDKVRGRMAGSTHYLTKPVSREKLLDVIQKCLPAPFTETQQYPVPQVRYAA